MKGASSFAAAVGNLNLVTPAKGGNFEKIVVTYFIYHANTFVICQQSWYLLTFHLIR